MFPHTAGARATDAAVADATNRARDWLVATAAVVVALIALYAVFMDNGQLVAATGEYLHEFSHDGRHLFGAPCH